MKKTLCMLLCMLMIFSLVSCGGDKDAEVQETVYTYEIGMLTAADQYSIDDEDNVQAAWEGVRQFAEEQGKTYKYYETEDMPKTDNILKRLEDAVNEGVKVIVASGPEVSSAIYLAQELYPDLKFIYLDGVPVDENGKEKVGENCISFTFNALQAGYLAGYSAVLEGYTRLGFIADEESDEAKAYGYGFLQGCNEAADRYNYYASIKYSYGSGDEKAGTVEKKAKSWYDAGTSAIFTYGVTSYDAVYAAAKESGKVIIASNVNKDYSKTVITSAMKNYQDVVVEQLEKVYEGSFKGGTSKKLGLKSDGVGLDMKHSKFTRFNQELYKAIKKEIVNGDVKIASVKSAKTPKELIEKNSLYYIGLVEE